MAITKPLYPGLSDVAQLTHNGNIVTMVHEYEESTSILKDMSFRPATDALQDVTGYVSEMPKGKWTDLDRGTKSTKGAWKQETEGMGMYEDWSEYNEKHNIVLGSDYNQARWEMDQLHIKAMAIEAEKGLLYGNPNQDANKFLGFIPRLNQLTDMDGYIMAGTNAGKRSPYVTLDCGGTSSDTLDSLLIVAKGPMAATCIYPKNMANNGLKYDFGGFENTKNDNGENVRLAKSHFWFVFGLRIQLRQTVVRIANINTSSDTCMDALRKRIYEAFLTIPQEYRNSCNFYANSHLLVGYNDWVSSKVTANSYANAGINNPLSNINIGGFQVKSCDSMIHGEGHVA